MKLKQLLHGLVDFEGAEHQVTGLSLNSQQIKPGELFIAIKGHQKDGRAFILEAVNKGARAVLCEGRGFDEFQLSYAGQVPIIPILDLNLQLENIVKRFYQDQKIDLPVVGVTGTNGKTTFCYLLAQSLNRLNGPCAILGTLGYGFLGNLSATSLTTMDILSLYKALKELKTKGAKVVAMEVSSHGLEQGRVKGVNFESAIFTNLTQDHLDYHGDMEAYSKAKQKLFQFPSLRRAIVNADSPYTEDFIRAISQEIPIVTYTTKQDKTDNNLSKSAILRVSVKKLHLDHKGIRANVKTPWGEGELRSSLIGEFNVSNLLAVLSELCLRGFSLEEVLTTFNTVLPAPGRMQVLGGIHTAQIIVDYAHTPDALENALRAARLQCRRRLWCVVGCGGDRDKDKRPKMGAIATLLADKVILTNDNPRTEDPHVIIDDILQGVPEELNHKVIVEEARDKAIEYAINHCLPVDTILIAGKGHENYQIIGDTITAFSDVEYVNTFLREENHEIIRRG